MKDTWKQANLTEEVKELLIKEREKYPTCDMLIFEDGRATCLVQKMRGYDAKPDACKEYPKDGICLNLEGENND